MKKLLALFLLCTQLAYGGISFPPGGGGSGSGSGVTTIGAFSASAQANGASIAGSTITFGPADASTPGMVSIGTQSWTGTKTFTFGTMTSSGSNAASTGVLRLANAELFAWRNAANTANRTLGVDSGNSLTYTSSVANTESVITASQTDNTNTGNNARFRALVAGASGGDPYSDYVVSGVTSWSAGLDNSDSDAFVISNGAPGTNVAMRFATGATPAAKHFGIVEFPVGAVGAPSVYFAGDATTGLYSTAAGALDIAVSGVRQASFTANSFNPLATAGYTYQIGLGATVQGIRINSTISSSAYFELASGNFGYGFFALNAADWKNKMRLTRLDGAYYSMWWGEQGQVYAGGNTTGQKGVTFTVQAQPNVTNSGGTTTVNASTTVTGSSTFFLERVGVGDQISVSSASTTWRNVTAIASNTSLTTDVAIGDGTSQTINVKRGIARWDDKDQNIVGLINPDGKWTIGKSGTTELLAFHGATEASGAGAATTLNAPAGAAGDPDVWAKVQYNGTTYVLPLWTP